MQNYSGFSLIAALRFPTVLDLHIVLSCTSVLSTSRCSLPWGAGIMCVSAHVCSNRYILYTLQMGCANKLLISESRVSAY